VSNQEQLGWEARFGRPAAVFAFAGALVLLVGQSLVQSLGEDRGDRIRALPNSLLSINDHPDRLVISQVILALAAFCLIPVFLYLFRAIRHRVPSLPSWFVYMIVLGPIFYGVSLVLGGIERVDLADQFAAKASDVGDYCPAIVGKPGEECAKDMLSDDVSPVLLGLSLAGSVATAFLFVMLPLRARRAGLMSQFMAILGVIAGALMVLQLAVLIPEITRAFWLGAVGALFLGRWPGGRGPAWETGEPDPWPSAAERRGLVTAGEGSPANAAPAANGAPPEPEPAPQRPSSRKRRRKR
jgi:hypothetical protein